MKSSERHSRHYRWGWILAGGDGTRLLPLARSIAGDDRPKQFCAVMGSETLLAANAAPGFQIDSGTAYDAGIDGETRALLRSSSQGNFSRTRRSSFTSGDGAAFSEPWRWFARLGWSDLGEPGRVRSVLEGMIV